MAPFNKNRAIFFFCLFNQWVDSTKGLTVSNSSAAGLSFNTCSKSMPFFDSKLEQLGFLQQGHVPFMIAT
jgi:hypothetical protein